MILNQNGRSRSRERLGTVSLPPLERERCAGTERSLTRSGRIDIKGQRFGRWLVISYSRCDERRGAVWFCLCECGTEREVLSCNLRRGQSQSCGCIGAEAGRESEGK